MEEKIALNKRTNLKVSPEILTNMELSINEKLILSLDYTLSLKKGYNIMTNVDIGKLFKLHKNIVGNCRKSLIEKGYLVKDITDKRKHILTDKLRSVKIPLINGKTDKRAIIIPFEIYSHPDLETGSKLLWGEYNSMSKTENGYFSKRVTTSKRMNVSVGSITNWTKELDLYGLLKEYQLNSGYYTKQKVVRTKEFVREIEKPIDECNDIFDNGIENDSNTEEVYSTLLPTEEKADLEIEKKGKKSISDDIDFKESFEKKEEKKENLWDSPSLPLGGITKFSDLPIEKKKKKKKKSKGKDTNKEDSDL